MNPRRPTNYRKPCSGGGKRHGLSSIKAGAPVTDCQHPSQPQSSQRRESYAPARTPPWALFLEEPVDDLQNQSAALPVLGHEAEGPGYLPTLGESGEMVNPVLRRSGELPTWDVGTNGRKRVLAQKRGLVLFSLTRWPNYSRVVRSEVGAQPFIRRKGFIRLELRGCRNLPLLSPL